MPTIVLYLCYIVWILLFSSAYNTSLIYCFVIWCLHTNKRRPCSSTLSGHPSSSFLRVWHLCLAQAYSFYALGTCVLCRCIYFTRVWKSDLHVYCGCIFLPAHCAFSWKAHFWTVPVETNITFLLQVYFGSTCFPKVKRTFNCFKIVSLYRVWKFQC